MIFEGLSHDIAAGFEEDGSDAARVEVLEDLAEGLILKHERSVLMAVGEEARGFRKFTGTGLYDPPRLGAWLFCEFASEGEARIVGAEGGAADEDSIDLGAEGLDVLASGGTGDPRV